MWVSISRGAASTVSKMKILYIAPTPPSPRFSGGGIRSFNTVRALSACAQVTVLAIVQDKDRPLLEDCKPWYREIVIADMATTLPYLWPTGGRTRWESYWNTISTLQPISTRSRDFSKLGRIVQDLVDPAPDQIWISSSWLAGSTPGLDWRKVVVDYHDLDYRVMRRTMPLTPSYGSKIFCENLEIWKQQFFDRCICKRAARALVCSEDDRRILGYDNVRVLPNCVDLPEKAPSGEFEVPQRLLFIGKLDYHPNVDAVLFFCQTIFPLIRQVEPRAHLYIVGRDPPAEIRALHTGTDVVVTGTVPDTTPYFNAAGIVIVPLRTGGGTRVKILEAFAHRKAVVSTTIGCEGLAVEQGVHLYQADTPRDFAARCVALMSDASMRRALGIAGRELVESHYSQAVFQGTVRRCVSEVTSSF
jgi:glycosyltransferase involved in cell wall biosynthesis